VVSVRTLGMSRNGAVSVHSGGVVDVNVRMACDGYWVCGCEASSGRVPWGCVGSGLLVVGSLGRMCRVWVGGWVCSGRYGVVFSIWTPGGL
jgi:hypothetical protein